MGDDVDVGVDVPVGVGSGAIDVGVMVVVGDVSMLWVGANLAISGELAGVGLGGVQATREKHTNSQTIKQAKKCSLSLANRRFGIDRPDKGSHAR